MVTPCSTCIHTPTASVGAIQLLQGHMVSQVREVTQVNKKQLVGGKKGHTGFQSSSAQIQSRAVPAQEGKKEMEGGYRDRASGADATPQIFTIQSQNEVVMIIKEVQMCGNTKY